MFRERAVAQMAAFFIKKRGRALSHLKLMKLLYLADREAINRLGYPISGDAYYSLDHGPILSQTLNHMDGDEKPTKHGWVAFVSSKKNNELGLRQDFELDDFDELSKNVIKVLEDIWVQFGHMSRWEIRDYTHIHCGEWKDPNGSRFPIEIKDILNALRKDEGEVASIVRSISDHQKIDEIFQSARIH